MQVQAVQAVSAIQFFAAACLLLLSPSASGAATFTDVDILNFALNLEVRAKLIIALDTSNAMC